MYSFFSSKKNSSSALTRSPAGTLGVVQNDPLALAHELFTQYFGAEVEALTTPDSWRVEVAKNIISQLVACNDELDPTPRAAKLLETIAIHMQRALSEQSGFSFSSSKFSQALKQLGVAISTHYQDYGNFMDQINSVKSELATSVTVHQQLIGRQTTEIGNQITTMRHDQECAEDQGRGGRGYDSSAATRELGQMKERLKQITKSTFGATEICDHFEKFVPTARSLGATLS